LKKGLQILILTVIVIIAYVPHSIADCPSCGNVCILRDPFNHKHCIKQGTDPVCQTKHNVCTQQAALDQKLHCVASVLGAATLATTCTACVGGTEGAGMVACAAPCAATPDALGQAGDKCH